MSDAAFPTLSLRRFQILLNCIKGMIDQITLILNLLKDNLHGLYKETGVLPCQTPTMMMMTTVRLLLGCRVKNGGCRIKSEE